MKEIKIFIILIAIHIMIFLKQYQIKFNDKKIKKKKVSQMFNQKNPRKIQQKKTIIPIHRLMVRIFWEKIQQLGHHLKIIRIIQQYKKNN